MAAAAQAQSESDHEEVATVKEEKTVAPTTRQRLWAFHRGCWLKPQTAESIRLVEAQFEPRPDDLFLATYPKSGTTWLKALAFAVTNRHRHAASSDAHPLLTNHPQDLVPFLELPDRRLRPVSSLEALASPRLLCTHMPLALLPPRVSALGCKVVYLCREPKDVLVSYWHFASKVQPADFTLDKAFELFCDGEFSYGPLWEHYLGYWRQSVAEPHRFLFLKYEDMMADPVSHVKMLAGFLRVPFSDEEVRRGVVEEVVDLCSFDKLKNLPVNSSGVSDRFSVVPIEVSSYFRAGKVGDWAAHLSPEMAKKLDDIVQEKMRGSGLNF